MHGRLTHILCLITMAVLLLAPDGADAASRERYVRRIVVTESSAPVPGEGSDWRQVQRRDDLSELLLLATPTWRNLWFPIEYLPVDLATDTATICDYYRNLGYLEATVVSAGTEPASRPDDRLQEVDVIIVMDGIVDSLRYRLLSVQFDGVAAFDTTELREDFTDRYRGKERWFSPNRAVSNLVDLGIRYANAGYLDTASVKIRQTLLVNPVDHNVVEHYQVQELRQYRVGGFRVKAEQPIRIDSTVVSDALHDAGLAKGKLFSRQGVLNAENYLLDLRVLRMAQVYPDTVSSWTMGAMGEDVIADSVGNRFAVVEVAERYPGELTGSFGYSDVSGWRAQEGVYYHNFLRKARTIGQESEIAVEPRRAALDELRFALLYGQPRIGIPRWSPVAPGFGTRIGMDHELQSLWEDNEVTVTTEDTSGTVTVTDEVRTRRLSWTVSFSRRIGTTMSASVSYRFSRTDSVETLFGSGENTQYDRTLILRGSYDTRANFLRPENALVVSGQVALADLDVGAKTMTARPELIVQMYHRLSRDVIGALSLSGGFYHVADAANYDIPDLFWRSNQTPVARGLSRNDLTTISRTVSNSDTSIVVSAGVPAMAYAMGRIEARLDPWEKVGVTFFTDVAQAWTGDFNSQIDVTTDSQGNETVSTGFDISTLRRAGFAAINRAKWGASVGFGPRIYWALPIRLDFAYPIHGGHGWKMEIGIGQAF